MEKILSIVIPAYNVEKYLERCLASFEVAEILEQIEVLVINDGSKDQTAAIAKRYCDRYPDSYFLYNKENGGHGSGINYGIHYARGKYFKVVDGDDWLNTEELPAFVKLLAQVDADAVAADFLCVQDGTEQILCEKHATSREKQYGNMADLTAGGVKDVIKMHALTIRTEILQKHDIVIDEHCYYVDCEYITYPIPYVKTVYFYPKFIYMYRLGRNGQSMDIRSMQKNRAQHMRVLNSLLSFYDGLEGLTEGTLHYIERCIAQVVENQFQIYISMGRQKEIQRELREWDLGLKEHYPGIYAATRKKSITMLRKTGYRILPIGAMVYQIFKNR
ncbi:glycosyltransferase family 2 protein [Roseburia hominis]|uniref:glycosyltransferase family 2 protein n=1 Tax=Roseburia hominis TaxID=301301 RepID=UPI0026F2E23C|nr:glycosyltransferase family 2 protein [Roseburia hominis]MCI7523142.1 glycosyltransferase family 2 protein [Roseburia hominis]